MIPALSICRYYYEQLVMNLILMPPTRMVMVALGLMGNLIWQLFLAIWKIGPSFARCLGTIKVGQRIAWNLNTDVFVGHMAASHRRNWRKADRAGVEARLLPNPSNSENFRFLYEISMQRLGVKSFYWFPE